MEMKWSLAALGVGMAAGAAAAILLPKSQKVQQAVSTAADAVRTAADETEQFIQQGQ